MHESNEFNSAIQTFVSNHKNLVFVRHFQLNLMP